MGEAEWNGRKTRIESGNERGKWGGSRADVNVLIGI